MKFFAGFLVLAMAAASAGAAEVTLDVPSPPRDDLSIPLTLQHYLTENHGKVLDQFDAGGGLQGWYLHSDYGLEVLYTTGDGTRLVDGPMFDAQGGNLRVEQLDSRRYAHLLEQFDKAATVTLGKGNASVYLVYEPHCGYCQELVRTLTKNPSIQLHLIPIAFMDDDSEQLAATLLGAQNPAAVLRALRTDPDAASLHEAKPKADKIAAVQYNSQMVRGLNIKGTPFLAWRDRHGHTRTKEGLPGEEELARILNQVRGASAAPGPQT